MKTRKEYTGQTLIDMGYMPDKWFAEALDYLNSSDLTTKQVEAYLTPFKRPPMISLHQEVVEFAKNIRAENELEEQNLESVVNTMRHVMRTPTVVAGAVMPDACPAGSEGTIPVGGVVATQNAIHP